jgi:acyl-CoA dehydrogenase
LGVSDELPLASAWTASVVMGLVDGPTEVHRETVARQVLKRYQPVEGLWPSQHLPGLIERARAKFADHPDALKSAAGADLAEAVEHEVGNW